MYFMSCILLKILTNPAAGKKRLRVMPLSKGSQSRMRKLANFDLTLPGMLNIQSSHIRTSGSGIFLVVMSYATQ